MPDNVPAVIEPNPTIIESHPAPPKEVGKVGPPPQKSSFAEKFRTEFAKLETPKADAPAKEETSEPTSKSTPTSKPTESTTEPTNPQEVTTATGKPESPLDVVLEKGKKEEPKTEEPDVLKEFDETKPDWKRARGVMKEQSQKIRDYEAKLKERETAPKSDPVDATRLQELEAALTDRDNRIKAINAEYSPEYQKLVGKYQTTADKIRTRMQSFGADGDSLLAALSLPYSKVRTDQIDVALGDLDAGKQGRIQSLIEELEGHGEEISEFRKDLPKKYEEIQAQHENAAREQHAQALKQLETEFVKISETLPDSIVTMREVPEDVPGGAEWNKEISEARANALRILKPDGSDFNESAAIAMKGARYDSLEKRYLALHKDHAELKKQMKEYDSSGPDFKGGGKPAPKTAVKPAQKFHDTLNAIRRGEMADV